VDPQVLAALITGCFGVLSILMIHLFIPFIKRIRKPGSGGTSIVSKPGPGGTSIVSKPKKHMPLFLQVIFGGVIGVALGYFVVFPFAFSTCSVISPTSVIITSPISDSGVPILTTVQGTSCHIPSDKELWILVVPNGVTAFYPQPDTALVSGDGQWSASATVGRDTDVGKKFVLIAALADQESSAALQIYINQKKTNGLERLPKGIQLMKQVLVVRE
jgi:hypothetical protein